jgi:hypothetical protein
MDRARWAAPVSLLLGFCALAGATAVAVAVGGTQRTGLALTLLAITALAVGSRATIPAAAGVGVMAWLFYAGFVADRHGHLGWHGAVDVERLAVLVGAALCGAIAEWAYLGSVRRSVRRSPGPADAAVISLAQARAERHGVTGA